MRILLLHQYFLEKDGVGGSRFNAMTEEWSKRGHEITVLGGMVQGATGKKKKEYKGKYFYKDLKFYPNVDIIRCHVSESYNVNFLGRLWGYFSFVFSSIWAGLFMLKGKYDVILVTSPPLFIAITGIFLSKIKRTPMVFEVRDLWPESAIDTGVVTNEYIIKLAYWFEKMVYKNSKLINVLTPAFKEILIKDKGINENKIVFIPNASDFTMAEKIEKEVNVENIRKKYKLEDKFVITYAGAHGVANHLIQLVEAAELLRNEKVTFILIGGGMRKIFLKEEVVRRKLNNVLFFDLLPKTEVLKFIYSSDMGASVLKKVDTFKTIYSNKTFDYMSCKKPILLAIDGVSRKLIEDADCGVYAEPENAKEIAQRVRDCMGNKIKLEEQGLNGFTYAKRYFDRKILAHQYMEHLETVI